MPGLPLLELPFWDVWNQSSGKWEYNEKTPKELSESISNASAAYIHLIK